MKFQTATNVEFPTTPRSDEEKNERINWGKRGLKRQIQKPRRLLRDQSNSVWALMEGFPKRQIFNI